MIAFLAIWFAAALAPDSQITWVSVSPNSGNTEVVVRVDGTVTTSHFIMPDGRLVVDIAGVRGTREATHALNRGGISRVRLAQFKSDVARVVVELQKPVEYSVEQAEGSVRIRFANAGPLFEPWNAVVGKSASAQAPPSAAPVNAPLGKPLTANAPVAQQKTAAAPVAQQRPVQRQERPFMVTYQNAALSEVLGDISDISGRTILPSMEARSKVITAEILPPGLPWDIALASILEANGLSMRTTEHGVIIVDVAGSEQEKQISETLVSTTIKLEHIKADSVARSLAEGILTPGIGKVSVLTAANALIITDTQAGVDRVTSTIPLLDVPAAQVEIDARIAFVDRTALEALGVSYDLKDSRGNQLAGLAGNFIDTDGDGVLEPTEENVILLGGNSIAALGNASSRVASPAIQLATSLVLGRHTLISFLEALQTVSLSDIQAKPMVRTENNTLARIQVGERTPVRVLDASAGAGGVTGPVATVSFQNTGIILEVTPQVTGDQVKLYMHAERSNIGAAPSDIGITFQTQSADNVVTVRDGETIVVGGLSIIERTESRSGIPLLMDIPILGALFRNTNERENRRDLIVMVTPRIVRDQ
ncbi:MAG TPA: AMIN domain-containing protein [Longimicrobiales bacterium]